MATDPNYRPRLSAELTHEQATRLFNILPRGWQKPIFQTLVNGIIELYDRGGISALGAVASKAISVEHVLNLGHSHTIKKTIKELQKLLEDTP